MESCGGLLKESRDPRCPLNISLQVGPNISVYSVPGENQCGVKSESRQPLLPCGPGVNDISILGVAVGNWISISTLEPLSQ